MLVLQAQITSPHCGVDPRGRPEDDEGRSWRRHARARIGGTRSLPPPPLSAAPTSPPQRGEIWELLTFQPSPQRLGQIGDQVVRILDADGDADQAFGDAGVGFDGVAVLDQAFDAAQ